MRPSLPPRRVTADWPTLLVPAPGCFPLAAPVPPTERALYLAMTPAYGVSGSDLNYRWVCWPDHGFDQRPGVIYQAAQEIRPTFVFMQLQIAGAIAPETIIELRRHCAPDVVICHWDGDQHYAPDHPARDWFVRLGRVCDTSLVVNTAHPAAYAQLGVHHPGFLEVGADPQLFYPAAPAPNVPPVVLLANGVHPIHAARTALVHWLDQELGPDRFAVFGDGWQHLACGNPPLGYRDMAPIYAAAQASLAVSAHCDLPRYTSDRLIYMLACGGLPVVEYFPDYEGLGLVDGANCRVWHTRPELLTILNEIRDLPIPDRLTMRAHAAALGQAHTWPARWQELQAIINAVRRARSTIPCV